jgi:predicted Zn-dependent protease
MKRHILTLFSVVVVVLFDSCAKNPVSGKREVMLMSTDQEIAMGKQADPAIVAQFGLYQNEQLQRFINEKGKQMAAVSHRKDLPYEFKIVDSPVINAFAVPGGFVYFTRGIMAHFNNEAEFAGVLGHEIGHITARHSAQQQSKSMLAQVGLIVGMVVSPTFAQFGEAAQQGLGLLFLKFGRDDERESDRLGVEYSTKIGYDATEMAEFFQTLHRKSEEAGQGQLPGFLSTHPSPADREVTVNKLAKEWQKKVEAKNFQVNRNSYLKMIDGLIYGEDPKQGFVENGVFYHPVLKFQFPVPAQWAVQNSPQQVQMAPQDGRAMMMLTLAQGDNLQAAAQQTLQRYNLQALETKNVTVNGLPALAMVADLQPQQQQQQQQQQQPIRTLTYLIQYGGNIYSLMGVTTANDFQAIAPTFSASMQNFREVTDQSIINRQPERVRVKTVKQAGTLADALRSLNTDQKRMEELAILNGMTLTERVDQGMLIKVIEK